MREKILSIIERNSRIDLKELAVLLGMEEIDVVNEVAAMEAEGVICGYHTLIDWEKTTQEKVSALIEVRVTPQRGQGFDNMAEKISKYPEVNAVYLISGGYDLLVSIDGKSLMEISRFVSEKLSALDSVLSTATHFILKKYKDHGTIFNKKEVDEREMITP
ncbi:MAG: Lrp/AsnC family transcriptional regulator [Lachnospiraceae bacterium]|nr:Lrp/AsnC family transcriptional regulator [Lachnospiraceae bacterium]